MSFTNITAQQYFNHPSIFGPDPMGELGKKIDVEMLKKKNVKHRYMEGKIIEEPVSLEDVRGSMPKELEGKLIKKGLLTSRMSPPDLFQNLVNILKRIEVFEANVNETKDVLRKIFRPLTKKQLITIAKGTAVLISAGLALSTVIAVISVINEMDED